MPHYNRDMLHCSQEQCKKKDQCYKYWLGQHFKDSGFQYASFYYPKEPVTEGCEYYVNVNYW